LPSQVSQSRTVAPQMFCRSVNAELLCLWQARPAIAAHYGLPAAKGSKQTAAARGASDLSHRTFFHPPAPSSLFVVVFLNLHTGSDGSSSLAHTHTHTHTRTHAHTRVYTCRRVSADRSTSYSILHGTAPNRIQVPHRNEGVNRNGQPLRSLT